MADVFDSRKRRDIMRSVRGSDTRPEMIVRRLVHRLGYRYRLHVRSLPGAPDMVFPSRGKVIFVHGCFWHRHTCRKGRSVPSTRKEFWLGKLDGNRKRDRRTRRRLRQLGYGVLVVWECQTQARGLPKLVKRIERFLG